jgi:tripartite-type tricarboxylate transporter receptor subunit TctC
MTDLIGGQVQSFMASVPSALAQIKGGTVRGLAVTSAGESGRLDGSNAD